MAKRGLSRPSNSTPSRLSPPDHDRWLADRRTGILEFELETARGQWVAPGTGRLTLVKTRRREVVAQEAARSMGRPVLPGSGIKGAVRSVFELLADSCNSQKCRGESLCDACSLFGALGRMGRVSFSDAAPSWEGSVEAAVEWIPLPWEPDAAKTRGDFRFYDLKPAVEKDFKTGKWVNRECPLARQAYRGVFKGRMRFWNLDDDELGRLLISLGWRREEAQRFPLRLGGGKYHGKGAVFASPLFLRLVKGLGRDFLDESQTESAIAAWITGAMQSAWGRKFGETLEQVREALTSGAEGDGR